MGGFSKATEISRILQKSRQKAEIRIIAEHRGIQQQQSPEITSLWNFPDQQSLILRPAVDRTEFEWVSSAGKERRKGERCPGVSGVVNIKSSNQSTSLKMKGSPSQVSTSVGKAMKGVQNRLQLAYEPDEVERHTERCHI